MPRLSRLPLEERSDLVVTALRGSEALEALARRHGVWANMVRKWRDEFLSAGQARLAGKDDQAGLCEETRQLRKELGEREQIIGELTVANRFPDRRATHPDRTT